MSETDWALTPHVAEYDDPMQTGRRSASGKLLWKCLKCGRETTGAERECRTFAMMSPAERAEFQQKMRERLSRS